MIQKNKIDEIVKICIKWNNRKITSKESMFKIFKINQQYILSELNPEKSKRKCKFCGKDLFGNLSYCNNECKWADRRIKP